MLLAICRIPIWIIWLWSHCWDSHRDKKRQQTEMNFEWRLARSETLNFCLARIRRHAAWDKFVISDSPACLEALELEGVQICLPITRDFSRIVVVVVKSFPCEIVSKAYDRPYPINSNRFSRNSIKLSKKKENIFRDNAFEKRIFLFLCLTIICFLFCFVSYWHRKNWFEWLPFRLWITMKIHFG